MKKIVISFFIFFILLGPKTFTDGGIDKILESKEVVVSKFLELKEAEKQVEVLKGSYNEKVQKKLDKKYEKLIKKYSKEKEYTLKEKQEILELQKKEYERIFTELEKLENK
ncbi:MAG: hypothetical protein MR673_06040 [Fusobacterium perfoetens]|uniref:hypothetical protein n=1 Tax=Fusobacterium perfoetens TaxID=852 RepID=UPI0023F19FDD|nr:hypothetical protein [Fusobacterium perfoetens]MCI6152675.1 hypothetical protein [Fusobacterium perfoetens]MDY3237673.1 hypothetical protein [Fusobacterium perfoetens]